MASKFGEVAIWSDLDLWISLFELLYKTGLSKSKKKETKSSLLNFVVGNVQKVIGFNDSIENEETEVIL